MIDCGIGSSKIFSLKSLSIYESMYSIGGMPGTGGMPGMQMGNVQNMHIHKMYHSFILPCLVLVLFQDLILLYSVKGAQKNPLIFTLTREGVS
jgi:hypothetical protein